MRRQSNGMKILSLGCFGFLSLGWVLLLGRWQPGGGPMPSLIDDSVFSQSPSLSLRAALPASPAMAIDRRLSPPAFLSNNTERRLQTHWTLIATDAQIKCAEGGPDAWTQTTNAAQPAAALQCMAATQATPGMNYYVHTKYCLANAFGCTHYHCLKLATCTLVTLPDIAPGTQAFTTYTVYAKTCTAHTCPANYAADAAAAATQKPTDAACCVRTCALHACGNGYVPKIGAAGLINPTEAACCDKTCAAHTCSNGYSVKTGVEALINPTDGKCCDKTCAAHVCANGYSIKTGVAALINPTDGTCCDQTCAAHTCSNGYSVKTGVAALINPTDGKCCDKTCAAHACTNGYIDKTGVAALINPTDDKCCDKTCAVHACPQGWNDKTGVAALINPTNELCCEQTCAGYACGAGYIAKVGSGVAALLTPTQQKCCDLTCAAHNCPTGYVVNASKNATINPSTARCCAETCALFNCGAGYVAMANATSKPNPTTGRCCEPTCAVFSCPTGFAVKASEASKTNTSTGLCCEQSQTCAGHNCPFGYAVNANASSQPNPTTQKCCSKSCEGWPCPGGKKRRSNASSLFNPTDQVCCEDKCASHLCPVGSIVKLGVAAVSPATDAACCSAAVIAVTETGTYQTIVSETVISGLGYDRLSPTMKTELKSVLGDLYASSFKVPKDKVSVALKKGSVVVKATVQPTMPTPLDTADNPTRPQIVSAVLTVADIHVATEDGQQVAASEPKVVPSTTGTQVWLGSSADSQCVATGDTAVDGPEACKAAAVAAGHSFYQYNAATKRCATTAFCDSPTLGTANGWQIYEASVIIYVGKHDGVVPEKCVETTLPVTCETTAANSGKRLNADHANFQDSFSVNVGPDGMEVCVLRTHQGGATGGEWGMDLEFMCRQIATTTTFAYDKIYDVGQPHEMLCPDGHTHVLDEFSCERAALVLGWPFLSRTEREDRPVGCYNKNNDPEEVFYNALPNPTSASFSSRPVCHRQAHVKAALGTNGCPTGQVVLSESECSSAMTSLGHPSLVTVADAANIPPGCSCKYDGKAYFKSSQTGSGRADLQPVCRTDDTQISIGAGDMNRKCVEASEPVHCDVDAADYAKRLNINAVEVSFTFEVTVRPGGLAVCARRTDTKAGWTMDLKIQCRAAKFSVLGADPSMMPVKQCLDSTASQSIGHYVTQEAKNKFRDPLAVATGCCGDNGGTTPLRGYTPNCKAVGYTYYQAARFCKILGMRLCTKSEVESGMLKNKGCDFDHMITWTSDTCDEGHVIYIGANQDGKARRGITGVMEKCVPTSTPVVCDADAANKGKRVNPGYNNTPHTFEVSTWHGSTKKDTGAMEVCVRRTDSQWPGWPMPLEIRCRKA